MSNALLGMPSPGMVGIDTNVLLRYVVHDDSAQFESAARVFRSLTPEAPGFITHVTLVELLWTLKRTYGMPRKNCLDVIRGLVRTDSLEFEDGESVVQALAAAEEGADFADALIAASGTMFGVTEVVTFDRVASERLGWRLLE